MTLPIMKKSCSYLLEMVGPFPELRWKIKITLEDSERTTTVSEDVRLNRPKLRKVSILALADMGVDTSPIAPCQRTIRPADLRRNVVADVYPFFRRVSPSAPLQHGLNFHRLIDEASANLPGGWAVAVRDTVVDSWRQLRKEGP